METKITIINFFGGPCAGKSQAAHAAMYLLKSNRADCEYVPEYAKELYYRGILSVTPQLEIFETQQDRVLNSIGSTDILVVDSPLDMYEFYQSSAEDAARARNQARELRDAPDVLFVDFFVRRAGAYQQKGRLETEAQALEKDRQILSLPTSMWVLTNGPDLFNEIEHRLKELKLI